MVFMRVKVFFSLDYIRILRVNFPGTFAMVLYRTIANNVDYRIGSRTMLPHIKKNDSIVIVIWVFRSFPDR